MLGRVTVCVHDVTDFAGNWVTVFVREKLPSFPPPPSRPLQPPRSEKDKPHPLDVACCQIWDSQSVGAGVTVATVQRWNTGSEWDEEQGEGDVWGGGRLRLTTFSF